MRTLILSKTASGMAALVLLCGCGVAVSEKTVHKKLTSSEFPVEDRIEETSPRRTALPAPEMTEPCKLAELSQGTRFMWSMLGNERLALQEKYKKIQSADMMPQARHRALFKLLEETVVAKYKHRPVPDYVKKGLNNSDLDLFGKVVYRGSDDYLKTLVKKFNQLLDMSNDIDKNIMLDNGLHQCDRFWSPLFTSYYFELCGIGWELRKNGIKVPVEKKDHWKNGR